ncbi:TetR family transcriptional regulator [Streptomyces sp. MST-110588]|nr:TetR family transcriptional regulator [Streptomyces sp. MST-110588]UNO43560.1 TetR family transcriptional regulator [Streptomyces sp. MST-110588]
MVRHRRRLTAVAVACAVAEGLDAPSMQRVASELGCTAMALCRHVPGKDQLITVMADTTIRRAGRSDRV